MLSKVVETWECVDDSIDDVIDYVGAFNSCRYSENGGGGVLIVLKGVHEVNMDDVVVWEWFTSEW